MRFYWFADRVEIQSPGGLYGEASPENFPNQNSYRNPVLAEAMKTLGFVNKFGRGVFRAQAVLEKNGNPPRTSHSTPILCALQFGHADDHDCLLQQQGGVGKTSLAYHLAWMFAEKGLNVVAADLDPQANLTSMFLEIAPRGTLAGRKPSADHSRSD